MHAYAHTHTHTLFQYEAFGLILHLRSVFLEADPEIIIQMQVIY